MQARARGVVGDAHLDAELAQVVERALVGGVHVDGSQHAERAGAAAHGRAEVVRDEAHARPLEERAEQIDAVGRGELALHLVADAHVVAAVEQEVAGRERDHRAFWRGGRAEADGGRAHGEQAARGRGDVVLGAAARVGDGVEARERAGALGRIERLGLAQRRLVAREPRVERDRDGRVVHARRQRRSILFVLRHPRVPSASVARARRGRYHPRGVPWCDLHPAQLAERVA